MSDDDMGGEDFSEFRPPALPEGITKEIVKEADSSNYRHPKKGDDLTVHYRGTLEDGTEFDSSFAREEPINFTLGEGKVIKGWEAGIPTMRKGELSKFTFQPQFAYGEAGNPPTIPANAVLTFEVELISWIAKDDVFRDGGVIRVQTQEGSGWENPKKGEEVLCNLRVLGKDGEVIQEKLGWEVIIGSVDLESESFTKVVEKVLGDMKLNEKCTLQVSEDYIFKGKGEVTIELYLEAMYEISDVSHLSDGTVMKKKVFSTDGEYSKPQDDVKVTLIVQAVTDGTSPVPGFSGPKEISFVTGSGEACDTIDCVSVTMTKGERAIVTCTAPSKCSDDLVGLGSLKAEKLVFTLEMVDFTATKEIHAMGGEEKVLVGLMRKEKGGDLFKIKRFELALMKYKKVTDLMNQNDGMSKDCKQRAVDLKHIAEMNKAACYLQLGDPTNALAICNAILKADRNNVKCLLRRAKAHFSRHEHVEAEKDLERVLELQPDCSEATALLPKVKQAQKVVDKGSSNAYAKMMQGLGKVGFGKENKQPEKGPQRKPEPAEEEQSKDHVAVTFKLEHKIEPGDKIFVIGGPESLGAWDVSKGIQLKRVPGPPDYQAMALGKPPKETHMWEADCQLPVLEGRTEYHYVIRAPSGDRLEAGKHVMQLAGMGGARVKCTDKWRDQPTSWEPASED